MAAAERRRRAAHQVHPARFTTVDRSAPARPTHSTFP
jgi:hypothetical protein